MKRNYREALQTILDASSERALEYVTLENALGRVLARDMHARFDLPDADKCAIDGYTFRRDSVDAPGARLRIVDESRAGVAATRRVEAGEAVFTMTGAVVPEGADTAVRIEDTSREGEEVILHALPPKGSLINPAGSEIARGERALQAGTRLDARKVALLAHLGHYRIPVRSRPRIGLVVSGDEVREAWEEHDRAGVRNSNLYLLQGLLEPWADLRYYGIVQDEPERMVPLFEQALRENDILLSSGGASKGKYDFTAQIVQALDLDLHFTATDIRPGRPLIFATREEKLFFGLPGYPSALLVNARLFLLPALLKSVGAREEVPLFAVAEETLRSKEGRVDLVRVHVENRGGTLYLRNAPSQQTSDYLSMALCDGLAMLDASRGSVEAGEVVPFLPF